MSFFPLFSSPKPSQSDGRGPPPNPTVTQYEAPTPSHIDASNPLPDSLHPHRTTKDLSSSSSTGGSANSSPDTKRRSTTLPVPTGLGMGRSTSTSPTSDPRRTSETTTDGGLGLNVETGSELGSRAESQVGKKKKKQRVATETFIIVRPPPSNSKRPLNLQIQLVMSRPGLPGRSASSSSTASHATNTSIILPTTPPVVDDSPVDIRAEHDDDDADEEGQIVSRPAGQPAASTSQTTTARTDTSKSPSSAGATPKKADENARRRASVRSEGGNDVKTSNRRLSVRRDEQDPTSDDDARSTASEGFLPISRSESMSSSASTFSSTSSAGSAVGRMSLSSLGLGGGKGGSRRIVPLYNLAVHTVMTTVVTDAGTEAKVAKFLKRSIDIANVGSLEAIEYWSTSTHHFLNVHSQPLSAQSTRSMAYIDSATGAGRGNGIRRSVDLNRLNVGVLFGLTSKATSSEGNASVPAPMPSEGRGKTRKFLNNLFRNPKLNEAATTASPSSNNTDRALSPVGSLFAGDVAHSPTTDSLYFGAPTFGTSPVVVGPDTVGGPVAGSRPIRYTWTIKRWSAAKGGGANNDWVPGYSSDGISPGEVVFTWQRSRSSHRIQSHGDLTGGRARRPDLDGVVEGQLSRKASVNETGSDVSASSVSASANTPHTPALLSPGPSDTSRSVPALPSTPRGKSRPVSMMSVSAHEDEGDSDPEDSETPWTCSIRVPSGSSSSKGRRGGQPMKWRTSSDGLTVATMYPTPHHPRVVAQLKMPLELPTLATGLATSLGADSAPVDEIMLTEENVKDCLFVTALWLVAREEFAGLGRKKKV